MMPSRDSSYLLQQYQHCPDGAFCDISYIDSCGPDCQLLPSETALTAIVDYSLLPNIPNLSRVDVSKRHMGDTVSEGGGFLEISTVY
jgi:hypothetical protein